MLTLSSTGFSYSFVPVMTSVITYSDYIARGFNLEDDFNPSMIPASAGDGMFLGTCILYTGNLAV